MSRTGGGSGTIIITTIPTTTRAMAMSEYAITRPTMPWAPERVRVGVSVLM